MWSRALGRPRARAFRSRSALVRWPNSSAHRPCDHAAADRHWSAIRRDASRYAAARSRPLPIAIPIFPGLTPSDAVGPDEVLSRVPRRPRSLRGGREGVAALPQRRAGACAPGGGTALSGRSRDSDGSARAARSRGRYLVRGSHGRAARPRLARGGGSVAHAEDARHVPSYEPSRRAALHTTRSRGGRVNDRGDDGLCRLGRLWPWE